jgi:hypothetical protein
VEGLDLRSAITNARHGEPRFARNTLAGERSGSAWAGSLSVCQGQAPMEVVVLNSGKRSRMRRHGRQTLDQLGEVRERAGQPVHLVDNDIIDLAVPDLGQKPLRGRPVRPPTETGLSLMRSIMALRLAGVALKSF